MTGKLTVQVEAFKPLRSNKLFAFCTFVMPEVRLRVIDATVHQSQGRRWIGLPAKPQIDRDGQVRRDDRGSSSERGPPPDDDGGGSDGDGGGSGSDPPPALAPDIAGEGAMSAPTPLAVLIARAEARALLWRFAEFDLTNAVDELEAEAEVSGLLAAIGQDEVDAILAAAFAAVCEPAVADGWTEAAAECHAARGERTLIAEIEPKHLALLRDLMAENISLDYAMYEIAEARRAARAAATATLAAVEYLIKQTDAERLRKWLAQHSAQERAAILRHLEQRKKVRPCQKTT